MTSWWWRRFWARSHLRVLENYSEGARTKFKPRRLGCCQGNTGTSTAKKSKSGLILCKWQRKPLWPNMGKSKQKQRMWGRERNVWFTHSIHITIQKAWRLYFVMRITVKNRTKKGINVFIPGLLVIDFFALFLKHDRVYLGASRCYFFLFPKAF